MKLPLVPLTVLLILHHLAFVANWPGRQASVRGSSTLRAFFFAHLILLIHAFLQIPVLVLILEVVIWCIGSILFILFLTNMLRHLLLWSEEQLFLVIYIILYEIICVAILLFCIHVLFYLSIRHRLRGCGVLGKSSQLGQSIAKVAD